ncbi:hypothetical protein OTU49_011123 [Cherax quadricarinatus]|uniref:Chitin-binding type-2 domain-containing protein n=1 Tax=Cherax quadricarinatus TaxID=27406 RepID=A0AAW0W4X0_CHEQU
MSTLLLSCLLFLGLWLRLEAEQISCTPSCVDIEPGVKIADPKSCRNYYICLVDEKVSDFTVECPEGQIFDAANKICANEGRCDVCDPPCKFSCPANIDKVELVADRSDCSNIQICVPNNEPVPSTCSDGAPYFNGTECTTDASQCCDPCIPFCSEPFTQIPDPTDCTNFYFCERKEYPKETSLYHCDEGNFDEAEGICSKDAECNEPCKGSL